MTDLNKHELRRLAEGTKGWQNLVECWPADQEHSDADWEVGAIDEDGNRYPVISINTQQYDCEDGAEKLARFIAAANPSAVLSLLDELKAANARLHEVAVGCATAEQERDQLRAEVESLRKDAERYRWLRDKSESLHSFYLSTPIWMTGVRFRQVDVDRSIDTAMAGEVGNG